MHRALAAFIFTLTRLSSLSFAEHYFDNSCDDYREVLIQGMSEANTAVSDAQDALEHFRTRNQTPVDGATAEEVDAEINLFCKLFDDVCVASDNDLRVDTAHPDFAEIVRVLDEIQMATRGSVQANPPVDPTLHVIDFSNHGLGTELYFCDWRRIDVGHNCQGYEASGLCDKSLQIFAPSLVIKWQEHSNDPDFDYVDQPFVAQLFMDTLVTLLRHPHKSLGDFTAEQARNLARLFPPINTHGEPDYMPAEVDQLALFPYAIIYDLAVFLAADAEGSSTLATGWIECTDLSSTGFSAFNGDSYRLFILGMQLIRGRAGGVKMTINDDGQLELLGEAQAAARRSARAATKTSASAAARLSNSTFPPSIHRTSSSARRRIR